VTIRPEEVRAKLEAGRTAIAERLHLLADEIEALPLEGATEALSWFGDQIERLLREADRILGADLGHHRP
jgi:selenocysteine lyase/cysteine desulfurase